MTTGAPDMCYVDLLHDDTLANILSRLMEPINIMHSALACKPWCHVITVHGILRRHRPPVLCGVFGGGRRSLLFSPTDQIASPDLAEKTSNVPTAVSQHLPGGPWSITDSLEGLILLTRSHKRHINSRESWLVLAIINPVTGDLQELPPCRSFLFMGAAILRHDTGSGRCKLLGGASELVFKVVCVVAKPGYVNGELIFSTFVHSAGPGDKWGIFPSRAIIHGWKFGRRPARVGDALFNYPFLSRVYGGDATAAASAHPAPADSTTLMLSMRTCTVSSVVPPPVSQVLLEGCTSVEYNRGDEEKLWFVCIHDLLVLRLYSHPKPPPEETSTTTHLGGDQWTLEREVQLLEHIEDLADADGELRARNVQSRNGYVFFATDEYGYFAVNLWSMRVQRLSGVQGEYMGRLYPFLCRQDLQVSGMIFWFVWMLDRNSLRSTHVG